MICLLCFVCVVGCTLYLRGGKQLRALAVVVRVIVRLRVHVPQQRLEQLRNSGFWGGCFTHTHVFGRVVSRMGAVRKSWGDKNI